ncbi:MAG: M42 family peptidase, partial [Oscillospiraceae bacterium]
MPDYNDLRETLRTYASITRVSGYEKEMAVRLFDDMKSLADRVTIDRIGNVIADFDGQDEDAPSIMVFAHMDTIGFIIRRLDPDGFIRVERMGGVPEKLVQGIPVLVGSEEGKYYNGVIGAKAYHVQSASDKEHVDALSSLFIDIGAKSDAELHRLGIEVGCPVAYYPVFFDLLNNRVAGTYLDDSVGMSQLIEIARALKAKRPRATVHLVGTVWEEFSARGAMIAARTAKTDMAICLLGPGAGDTPDQRGYNNVELGGGPAVTLFNFHGKGTLNGMVAHKGMQELLKSTANELGIP